MLKNDEPATLEPDQLAPLPVAQLLVGALARHADDLSDLALREFDRRIGAAGVPFACQSKQRIREPPRQTE